MSVTAMNYNRKFNIINMNKPLTAPLKSEKSAKRLKHEKTP